MATEVGEKHAYCVGTSIFPQQLEVYECGVCGVTWGMTSEYVQARKDDHEFWRCPNGHSWHFSGENEKERLKRELKQQHEARKMAEQRAQSTRDLLRHEERSHAATKGVVTRKKKEIDRLHAYVGSGVCPVPGCRRHFVDLGKHMETKHADWKQED